MVKMIFTVRTRHRSYSVSLGRGLWANHAIRNHCTSTRTSDRLVVLIVVSVQTKQVIWIAYIQVWQVILHANVINGRQGMAHFSDWVAMFHGQQQGFDVIRQGRGYPPKRKPFGVMTLIENLEESEWRKVGGFTKLGWEAFQVAHRKFCKAVKAEYHSFA